ncbi:hypothetical protein EDB92DRAFT_2113302 [Lactarius akahatsu]|uniref:Uncharacterized protein n=1 Tax=Lactarius akahatsu TaxID=416441 RepID=A0AAD4LJ06_9AGAM|nr:hypothetical protein EDB92DRAFT_2113302 [Lactarius akahatsu]
MSSTSSSPISSSTTASAPAATSSSSSPGTSPPIFVGFVGVGILTLCLISLCVWRKLIGRNHPFAPAQHDPHARLGRPQNDGGVANGRPEMFDAWTGERVSDGLEWENSMPFSVTIVESGRASDAALRKGKAGKHRGNSEGNLGLQVAVLVAMPSPLHARRSHDGRSSLRGELAIGLIKVPREDRHSIKRNAS